MRLILSVRNSITRAISDFHFTQEACWPCGLYCLWLKYCHPFLSNPFKGIFFFPKVTFKESSAKNFPTIQVFNKHCICHYLHPRCTCKGSNQLQNPDVRGEKDKHRKFEANHGDILSGNANIMLPSSVYAMKKIIM